MKNMILLLICAFIAPAISANSPVEEMRDSTLASHRITFTGDGTDKPSADAIKERIESFYMDQFRHSQDPLAPYFLLMSRDANLAMGMGGLVKMRGWFDWGGALPSGAFAPYLIPMHKDPATMRDLGTTPDGTSLFFRVIGRNHKLRDYQLFIEAEFNGYGARDFKLKNAYVIINDWTIGLAASSFSDLTALPPTIDTQGPNARMAYRPVLVRWSHQFKHGIIMGVSLETPDCKADYSDGITCKVNQWMPDAAAFLQYSWGSMQHVRLAGVFRNYPYRNLLTGSNHNVLGWGFHLSTVIRPIRALTLYGSINGGQGYASMACDWLMGNYDLVNHPGKSGHMYAPGAVSGFIAAQYHFRYDLSVSAMLGGARYLPHHGAPGDEYQGGTYMAVNGFYNLTPRIQFGAEFNLGRRRNIDNSTAWGRRIGMLAQFSF